MTGVRGQVPDGNPGAIWLCKFALIALHMRAPWPEFGAVDSFADEVQPSWLSLVRLADRLGAHWRRVGQSPLDHLVEGRPRRVDEPITRYAVDPPLRAER